MRFHKLLILIGILAIGLPLLGVKKAKEVKKQVGGKQVPIKVVEEPIEVEMKEEIGAFRPEQVNKEWRIAALQVEIDHAQESIAKLEEQKKGLKDKKGKEFAILQLRLMLKNNYLGGLKEIMAVEKGEKKPPKMMEAAEYEEEYMEEPMARRPSKKRPMKRARKIEQEDLEFEEFEEN